MKLADSRRSWSSRRRFILLSSLIVLIPILLKGGMIARAAFAAMDDYRVLQVFLRVPASELAQTTNRVALEGTLVQSEMDLRQLRGETEPFFGWMPYLAWVPHYGSDLAQMPALMDYAVEATVAGRTGLEFYRSLLKHIPEGDSPSQQGLARGQVWLNALGSIRPEAENLRAQLARTAQARQKVDPAKLTATPARLVNRADTLLGMGLPALQALDFLPGLLGAQGTRRYLLIAQNNDELRATGGFISGAGLIEVKDGKIATVSFKDSYALDDLSKPHLAPPVALAASMWAGVWVFRDGNWSPDFPTSAQTLEKMYQIDQGVSVDGVIAVNLGGVQRLVTALAPIDLPAYNERVDGNNVLERMEYYFTYPEGFNQPADWWSHRKDFIGALMQAILARVNGETGSLNVLSVAQAVWGSLAAKDILIYLNDPSSQAILRQLRWDGALPEPDRDIMFVVDSNVGFNKVDRRIKRWYDYRVELQPGAPARGILRMQYRNLNQASGEPCVHEPKYGATYAVMRDNCYWDYVRVYLPPASRPISATQEIAPAIEEQEKGYSVLSGYFVLPRDESREISFAYWLPSTWIRADGSSEYRLNWIKQPGADPAQVRVTVAIPPSLVVTEVSPSPSRRSDSELEFLLPPDRDSTISIQLAPGSRIPELVWWGLAGLGVLIVVSLSVRRFGGLGQPANRDGTW